MKEYLWISVAGNVGLFALGWAVPGFKDFAADSMWLILVAGYWALTLLLFRWIVQASKKSPIRFITAVNGATGIKMLVSLAIVTVYLVAVGGEHRVAFAFGLFAAFALNTTILVIQAQKMGRA
ncbi:MAG: hypothetical protein P8K81_07280 [Flavobacteriales bacterium]|nr:hypothetical protein [Flavobacteriales bacterium]